MWKRVVLYTLSGFLAVILTFIVFFSNEIAPVVYRPYPDDYYGTTRAQELWQTTLGKQLSLLQEKVSLCNLRGRKRIQTNAWSSKHPTYKCYLPYSDHNKPCHSSNECQGGCIVNSPKIGYTTFLSPSEDATLAKLNCTELTEHQNLYSKTYRCEKNSFEGRCATFNWDKYNQWAIVDDTQINFISASQDLRL